MLALVDEKEGVVSVGGTVLGTAGKNAGDGVLGTLSFEVLEGFTERAELVISRVSFRRLDGEEDKRTVRSVATITREALLTGDFDGSGVVNFEDFFLFADHFGTVSGDDGYDALYDLNGSGGVDFEDFFLFADSFGREARAKLMALARAYLGLPESPRLMQNYPNPFNSSTTIQYQISASTRVRLDIFNLTGQRIKSLLNGYQLPGSYEVTWDGTDERGTLASTGIYLIKLQTDGFCEVRKVLLIK